MIPTAAEPLLRASRRALRQALSAGFPIAAGSLDDTEYQGISLALPWIIERFTWKTFTKTFRRTTTGELVGWNMRMEQTGVDGPPAPKRRNGVPLTWGHYRVRTARGVRFTAPYDQALLIDYDVPTNGPLLRRMRDPLVAVVEGSSEVLLGVSYLDLGFFGLMTPTYFALILRGPLSYVPPD